MGDLEKINEENYSKYGIKVEELKLVKQSEKFKNLRELFLKFFSTNEDSFFWAEPLFIDACLNNDGKVSLNLKLCHADKYKIFDDDYYDISSKHLEIYDKKYLEIAEKFKREYKNLFNEEIYLINKFLYIYSAILHNK